MGREPQDGGGIAPVVTVGAEPEKGGWISPVVTVGTEPRMVVGLLLSFSGSRYTGR